MLGPGVALEFRSIGKNCVCAGGVCLGEKMWVYAVRGKAFYARKKVIIFY